MTIDTKVMRETGRMGRAQLIEDVVKLCDEVDRLRAEIERDSAARAEPRAPDPGLVPPFVADDGWSPRPSNPNIPEGCNSCGRPLLLENLYVDDGCPCNSRKGVNFAPIECSICREPCVKPGHRLASLFGDAVPDVKWEHHMCQLGIDCELLAIQEAVHGDNAKHAIRETIEVAPRARRRDYDAMLNNLTATQERCSSLLNEQRAQHGPLAPVGVALELAREKHPEGASLAALTEEFLELTRELLTPEPSKERVRDEAIDVAVVAIRMALGEVEPTGHVLPSWRCEHCQCFNGAAKEVLPECRACGKLRIP